MRIQLFMLFSFLLMGIEYYLLFAEPNLAIPAERQMNDSVSKAICLTTVLVQVFILFENL